MRRLNKARVGLKHHGTLPSKLDVQAFAETCSAFWSDATPLVFGVTPDSISLSSFVSPAAARAEIDEAIARLEAGDAKASVDHAALALRIALDDYDKRKRSVWGSPFDFGESFSFSNFDVSELERTHDRAARVVKNLVKSVEALQSAMKYIALGIDFRRYARFELVAPNIVQTMDGKYHLSRYGGAGKKEIDSEDARYAIDFVIDAAIRIVDFDYDVPLPPWLRRDVV